MSWWRHLSLRKEPKPSAVFDLLFWIDYMDIIFIKNAFNSPGKSSYKFWSVYERMIRKTKKSVTYEITREMNTVDNWTQHLQLGHLKIMIFSFFSFLKLVTKRPGSQAVIIDIVLNYLFIFLFLQFLADT